MPLVSKVRKLPRQHKEDKGNQRTEGLVSLDGTGVDHGISLVGDQGQDGPSVIHVIVQVEDVFDSAPFGLEDEGPLRAVVHVFPEGELGGVDGHPFRNHRHVLCDGRVGEVHLQVARIDGDVVVPLVERLLRPHELGRSLRSGKGEVMGFEGRGELLDHRLLASRAPGVADFLFREILGQSRRNGQRSHQEG